MHCVIGSLLISGVFVSYMLILSDMAIIIKLISKYNALPEPFLDIVDR